MKNQILECPIKTNMDLVIRTAVITSDIQEKPDNVENMRQSLTRNCETCITAANGLLSNIFKDVH